MVVHMREEWAKHLKIWSGDMELHRCSGCTILFAHGVAPFTGGERLVVRSDGVIRVPDLCGTCKVVPMERCHG